MGKQVNFYMDYQTECRFVDLILQSNGQILTLQRDVSTSVFESLPEGSNIYFCLYKPEFGPLVYKGGSVDILVSPVIEFSRSIVWSKPQKGVNRGRLWIEMYYRNNEGNIVSKSKELDRWYGSLSRWIRNNLKERVASTYATTEMVELERLKYRFW